MINASGTIANNQASSGIQVGRPISMSGSGQGLFGGANYGPLTTRPSDFPEWRVIKVNRRGRPQERIIGLDFEGGRITNRKVEKRRLLAHADTVTAERKLDQVVKVEAPIAKPKVFIISYVEGAAAEGGAQGSNRNITPKSSPTKPPSAGAGKNQIVDIVYEAASAEEREEILSKLNEMLLSSSKKISISRG